MSEHELNLIKTLEKTLKKQYVKYLITGISFLVLGCAGFYISVRLTLSNHDTRIQQNERDITKLENNVKELDGRLFNHVIKQ